MSCSDNNYCETGCFPNVRPPQTSDDTSTLTYDTSALTGDTSITDSVKEYYGKVLQNKDDLKTGVCLTREGGTSELVKSALKLVHQDVQDRYYGCGVVIPDLLEGAHVLDLGSGAGLDCFVVSKLVGQNGHVTGVDMTDEQIDVARNHIDYHTKVFGYQKPNVDFLKGYIEKLEEAGVRTNYYDIIISNCVINLSPDKPATLREAFAALKVGGEMYFSDVYADRDLPEHVRKHTVLWGECVAGALCWKDLYKICEDVGFRPPRLVTASRLDLKSQEMKDVTGDAEFVSATYRLFKLPSEKEAPGQVIYNGGVEGCADKLTLDHKTTFKTGEPAFVDSEVTTILKYSRFSQKFTLDSKTKKVCCEEPCQPIVQIGVDDPFKFCQEELGDGASCCQRPACC